MYPAKFPGLGEALIFFCFFSCIKTRKEEHEGKKKYPFFDVDHSFPTGNVQRAYAIRPYRLPADGFRIRFATSFSKTRRVSLRLVAKPKTRRVLRYVVWRNAKPIGRQAVGAYCIRPLGVFGRKRMIDTENRRFFLALIIFFSSLDGRKGAKEDQGLTEAGEFGRVHDQS